jgi:dipeptidyl aminopeptidase/acylaminoacyl peptidase
MASRIRVRKLFSSPCGLLASIGVVATLVPSAQAAFPGQNGRIAFDGNPATSTGGPRTIYTISADGSGLAPLTNAGDFEPAWSADGQKIAFTSARDGNDEIYVMNADGSGQTRLTFSPGLDLAPAWSPDGARIAFISIRDAGAGGFNIELYVMNADGSDQTRLTLTTNVSEFAPAWSPDGDKIAFSVDHLGISTINSDGSGRVFVMPGDNPSWFPDGSKLAFDDATCDDQCEDDVYVANADGTGRTQLMNTTYGPGDYIQDEYDPAVSPDGRRIAFVTNQYDGLHHEIAVMNADGSGQNRLTNTATFSSAPDWQPLPNRPPDCSGVAADPGSLALKNHRFRLVTLSGASDPDGDPVKTTITGVTQDERVTGPGDHTSPDAVAGDSSNEVWLRAESGRRGDGRVYRIAFEASDGKGGTCTGRTTVEAPKRRGVPAIDSAPPSYDSFGL